MDGTSWIGFGIAAPSGAKRTAFAAFVARLRRWHGRARERRFLARLDDLALKDIGITRGDARRECAKPFWRA
jgi:uncharacterized protein YjiS (DUF1127 family)